MRFKRLIYLFFLPATIFIHSQSFAQGSNQLLDLPTVIPPSPNAAALGKFGDIPVGNYTGIPSVNIPLYEMKMGKFTLPVSLDYHYGGLKVEELSGCIGLGWALNAGGAITRSVHGNPDETGTGYWHYNGWSDDLIASTVDNTTSVCGGNYDLQPDIFYYNFAGQSGKFLLDSTAQHNARFIPFSNLQVTHASDLSSFQITDANGIVYIFSSIETTSNDGGTSVSNFISAWFLTTIITPAGNINFTYAPENTEQTQISEVDYLNITYDDVCWPFNPGYSSSTSSSEISSLVLTKISSPFETITFNTAPNRQDMPTANSITGLTVSDINGRSVKKIALTQSYFGNPIKTGQNYFRLKLDRVDDISVTDSTQKRSYVLEYNSPTLVPSVSSFAKDYWGFYNGQDQNKTDLPYIDPHYINPYVAGQATFYGNRNPDYTKAMIGALQSIQYPTGGTSQFIYEGNDYSRSGGTVPVQYKQLAEAAVASARDSGTIHVLADTVYFSVNEAQLGVLTVIGRYSGEPPEENGPSLTLNQINVDGGDSNVTQLYMVDNTQTSNPILHVGNYQLIASVDGAVQSMTARLDYYQQDTAAADLPKILPTGGIRIREIVNTDPVSGNINTKVYRYRIPGDTTMSSGVLASSVVNLDTKLSQITNCGYYVRASSSASYLGTTQGSHIGYGAVTETDSGNINVGRKESYYSTPLNFQNMLGRQRNIVDTGELKPLALSIRYVTDYDVFRGFLQKELIYNGAGSLLHSSVNTYNYTDTTTVNSPNFYAAKAIVGYINHICVNGCDLCTGSVVGGSSNDVICSNYNIQNYTLVDFQVLCPWIFKINTINTTYDQNGQNPVIDTINYYYDNPSHGQITRIYQTDSKGDSLKTYKMYATEKAQITGLGGAASAALDSMVSRNMVAPVIEEDHYNNGQLVTRARTDYAIWAGPRRNISPVAVWYQNGSYPMENRLNFLSYDSNENVIQVAKADDMNISYLWDYNSLYPIAQVKNADSASIAYTSFEANGTGNWSLSGGTVDNTQGITGTNSYQNGTISKSGLNPSTTYIVSYWSQNGAYSIPGTISGYPRQGKTISFHTPGWTLYVHKVTGQSTITVNATGHIDELRLYPSTAQMTTYTYDPLVGMTSQMDAGSRATYYEYDGLQRLKRVRDQDYNILKTIDYAYQAPAGCGSGCYSVAMQTFAGTNTLSYPVGVFDVNGNLVGNASNASAYVSLWNTGTADARVGTLSLGQDSMHFNLALNAGQTLPASVTGLRYYQMDLAWNQIDAVRQFNGAYIDFGDGTGIRMPPNDSDTPAIHPPNTTYYPSVDNVYMNPAVPNYYFVHSYPDTSLKTITCYHNDAAENSDFDNDLSPASSLTRLSNLRGNLPAHTNSIGGSSYQQASMTSLQGVNNWNSITSVQYFRLNNGDFGINSCLNISYPQDFMANNKSLKSIQTRWGYIFGVGDTTFKISRLKSDWNTYFTQLQSLSISDRDWNHENLSSLTHLNAFSLTPNDANGGISPNGPFTPLDSSVIDNVLIQIAAGAGQTVNNGAIAIVTGGSGPTSASRTAMSLLISKGWQIYIDGVLQTSH